MRFDTFSQFNPTVDLAMLRSGLRSALRESL